MGDQLVRKVERDKEGRVLSVEIESGHYVMRFVRGSEGEILLSMFKSYRIFYDEPIMVPSYIFKSAMSVARGIFSSGQKRENRKKNAQQLQLF